VRLMVAVVYQMGSWVQWCQGPTSASSE